MAVEWLIYGANGYTGELVARLAVARGQRPVLAGRRAEPVARLAAQLGLAHRIVDLTDAAALRQATGSVAVVAHCAGPFSATAAPMVDACLDTGTHYLDITGEIEVFEAVFARHAEAVAVGTVLLPGAGFDVVPTDCLAARVAAALPGATSLELAFQAGGGLSAGTTRSSLEGIALGSRRRVDGLLVPTPYGEPSRIVPFPSGQRRVGAIRWGDLASAYRSTGIPTITTYLALPPRSALRPGLAALRWGPVRKIAARLVRGGPDAARRAASRSEVWAQATRPDGEWSSASLVGPNCYDLTADSVVRAVPRLAAGDVPPGAHTPSTAFGAGYVETLDGVTVT
jgi:saccharopine dehydrogenase (NAD+, L-lysine-forming)